MAKYASETEKSQYLFGPFKSNEAGLGGTDVSGIPSAPAPNDPLGYVRTKSKKK